MKEAISVAVGCWTCWVDCCDSGWGTSFEVAEVVVGSLVVVVVVLGWICWDDWSFSTLSNEEPEFSNKDKLPNWTPKGPVFKFWDLSPGITTAASCLARWAALELGLGAPNPGGPPAVGWDCCCWGCWVEDFSSSLISTDLFELSFHALLIVVESLVELIFQAESDSLTFQLSSGLLLSQAEVGAGSEGTSQEMLSFEETFWDGEESTLFKSLMLFEVVWWSFTGTGLGWGFGEGGLAIWAQDLLAGCLGLSSICWESEVDLLSDHLLGVAELSGCLSSLLLGLAEFLLLNLEEPPLGPRGGLNEPLVEGWPRALEPPRAKDEISKWARNKTKKLTRTSIRTSYRLIRRLIRRRTRRRDLRSGVGVSTRRWFLILLRLNSRKLRSVT